MRVHLEDRSVLDLDEAGELIVALLQATGDGRHILVLDEPLIDRARDLLRAETNGKLRRRLEESLDHALAERDTLDRTVTPGTRPNFPHAEIALASHPSDHCVFTIPPENVRSWLHEPLFLLTENDIDGALIVAAARGLERKNVLVAMNERWVRVNGRGGTGEIPPRLHRSHSLERLFVLVDSDRNTWSGPVTPKVEEIEELCQDAGIPCHVLVRREAENYLPLSFVDASSISQGRASTQLKRGVRALRKVSKEEHWVLQLDEFFADQARSSANGSWSSKRCKRWLRELLFELQEGNAELDAEAVEHLKNLVDELERWI